MHFPFPVFDLSFDLDWVAGNATANSESQILNPPISKYTTVTTTRGQTPGPLRAIPIGNLRFRIGNLRFEIEVSET
jgi:hypothetical protein